MSATAAGCTCGVPDGTAGGAGVHQPSCPLSSADHPAHVARTVARAHPRQHGVIPPRMHGWEEPPWRSALHPQCVHNAGRTSADREARRRGVAAIPEYDPEQDRRDQATLRQYGTMDEVAEAGRLGADAGSAIRSQLVCAFQAESESVGRSVVASMFGIPRTLLFGPEREERARALFMAMAA